MHFLHTHSLTFEPSLARKAPLVIGVLLVLLGWSFSAWSQETDFSPYARFGLGTSQGNLTPNLASMAGITSISASNLAVNADQPAAAAGLTNPTFQGSIHMQGMQLTEGEKASRALTGSPGNFGLVIKQPRSRSALQLGLTPLTSKAFSVTRTTTDSTLTDDTTSVDLVESYNGSGGLARAYVGLAHGWRGRRWVQTGAADSVWINSNGLDVGAQIDHWFGDAVQTSTIDVPNHLDFRDVRKTVSSRHRGTGLVLGAEAFQVLQAKYNDSKQFEGSLVLRAGGTYSPQRQLNTDFYRLVESTLIVNNVVTGIDTSAFDEALLQGTVPAKWTAGAGLQWDGPRGNRIGAFVDYHHQAWSSATETLPYLMDEGAAWGDASAAAFGVVWTPARKTGKIVRPTYRAGVRQAVLPVVISSQEGEASSPLQERRLSFGMNAPLKGSRSASQFHFGMDVGQRYTDLETTHRETNIRLHVGVTLTPFAKNLWLTPRLYD